MASKEELAELKAGFIDLLSREDVELLDYAIRHEIVTDPDDYGKLLPRQIWSGYHEVRVKLYWSRKEEVT